ncbi:MULTISPECIES: hypothetical protein [unclassified Bradyrhizobium]|uniref:hypothetical protein n=1 Tax=unclassified Bradyrhizobium TaxID=2631580 RepID=UPI002915CB14|nr:MULTISPECIES: hypothetical protein [unclassified Bradyrhizobium]
MELLSNEAFKALVAMYEQQCAADILATQPQEVKRREQIYASYLGFEGFLALVRKFAEASETLATHQSKQVDAAPDPIDDPSVHDIYGHEQN